MRISLPFNKTKDISKEKMEFPQENVRSDNSTNKKVETESVSNIDHNSKEKDLQTLTSLIVETWRLRMAIFQESRFIQDIRSIKRLQNQITRFDKHYFPTIENLGIQILDFTNRIYEPGQPVNPINLADFTAEDEPLRIEVMMEPIIKIKGTTDVIHRGIVVLGRAR